MSAQNPGKAESRLGQWTDHREDPAKWAEQLGVPVEACELVLESDLIDLHVDPEVPARLFGYDPAQRHQSWKKGTPFFGHVDFPRLLEGSFTGVVWDVATNPFRLPGKRKQATLKNLKRVEERIAAHPELALVRNATEYRQARSDGRLAVWVALQGGNALARNAEDLDELPRDLVCRITLVHLTNSRLGSTSSPLRLRVGGLSDDGREYLQACQERRILVDLAHIHPKGFWGAVECARPDLPLIASHTGVDGVRPYWRNLDDEQVRAIAKTGGVVGLIYHSLFLEKGRFRTTCERLAAHILHVFNLAGEDTPALGSDYDGFIVPPKDLPDPTHHPRLVQCLMEGGLTRRQIQKILGLNWLRVVESVRP